MSAAGDRPPGTRTVFDADALGITTVLTLVFVLLVEFNVPWLLIPFGLFVLFAAPGYGAAALLFGRRALSSLAMNLALIVGLSVLINVVVGTVLLVLEISPLAAILGAVDAALCTVATAVQFRRPWEAPLEQRILRVRTAFELPGFSRPQRAAAYALFAGILLTFAAIGYLSSVPTGGSPDLSLAIVGPDGTTATLPTTGGVNTTISLTVDIGNNASAQSLLLSVSSVLVGQNATSLAAVPWTMPIHLAPNVTSSEVVSLSSDAHSTVGISFQFNASGDYRLLFSLSPTGSSAALRSVALSLRIS